MASADFDNESEEVLRELLWGMSAAAPAPQPGEDTQDWENAAEEALAQVSGWQGAWGPQHAQGNGHIELPVSIVTPDLACVCICRV